MKIWAFALLLIFMPTVHADHLYPEPSQYGGDAFLWVYDQQLLAVLKDAMDIDVVLRMVEVPSFIPESAVWIEKTNGQFEILALDPSEPVWGYSQRHAGKIKIKPDGTLDGSDALNTHIDDPTRMPVKKCKIAIAQSTEEMIAKTWERSLLQVHYDDKPRLGSDGASFHFAMRKGPVFMAGTVWSPDPSAETGKLVQLASAMHDYCKFKNPGGEDQIRQQASNLLRDMQ